ncbi:MAG: hypothetical protein L3J24_02745 [Xanthomonadales bacterium]|nr:hypothetical protein [Xanthomonadales bacterium]
MEWIFNGVGVFVISLFITFLIFFFSEKRVSKRARNKIHQSVKANSEVGNQQIVQSGRNSVNTQIQNISINHAREHLSANIEFVDITVEHQHEAAIIDVKLRNNSDEIVFIKQAVIETIGHWDLPLVNIESSAVPVSRTYDINILSAKGSANKLNISQAVAAQSVDRFQFSISSDHKPSSDFGVFAFLLKITLIYNEDNKTVSSAPLLTHIPVAMVIHGFAEMPEITNSDIENNDKKFELNRETAREALKAINEDTIVDAKLIEAIKSFTDINQRRPQGKFSYSGDVGCSWHTIKDIFG